jgi:anthranilate synthase component 1
MQTHFVPSFEEFQQFAQEGNLIPVRCEVLADMETPVSAFLKLRSANPGADAFLLESVEGGEHAARYSFLGVGSRASLITKDTDAWRDGVKSRLSPLGKDMDPLHLTQQMLDQYQFVKVPGLPRFCGGAVGYLGYDLVRFFENLPNAPKDDRGIPDLHLLLTDTLLIFDAVRHSITILNNAYVPEPGSERAAYNLACQKIEQTLQQLQQPSPNASFLPLAEELAEPEPKSNFARADYEKAVSKCVEYIRAGDCVQVVPSQRFEVPLTADTFDVYRALRHVSPAPYMFYLSLGDVQLIGASPEVLVTEDDRFVTTRPLAGTRKRGVTPAEDEALKEDLLADPKERAEHIMLVDLHRNDIGRVCEYGSVEVDKLMYVEKFSHVMHLTSNVIGKLRPDKNAYDLLRATFPAGTLSGAPKVRAMEIIDEIEPTRRGPYGGVIGYFSYGGNLDTCITLRTIVVKDGVAYVQAGGGVVADSDPAFEYEETRNKARAALRAIALAENTAKEMTKSEIAKTTTSDKSTFTPDLINDDSVIIYCDGACSGNPGPGGWGAIVKSTSGVQELSGGESKTTNNRMEMQALLGALEHVPDAQEIRIVTDSEYLSKGITQWMKGWKRNGWKTKSKQPVKNRELWEAIDAALEDKKFSLEWVKGHAGHPENERCDELAREAIDRM